VATHQVTEQLSFEDPPPAPCGHGRVAATCYLCVLPRVSLAPTPAQTRREADEAVQPVVGDLRERVYRAIVAFGPISDQRLAEVCQLADNTERPRRRELEQAGRIIASGTERTRSGRKAVTWVITD
jgi:hypothetical protein